MKPNPKLHKERIRTSSQRPDVIIAFQNFFRRHPGLEAAAGAPADRRTAVPKRSA